MVFRWGVVVFAMLVGSYVYGQESVPKPVAQSVPSAWTVDLGDGVEMRMVWVPAGSFNMGSQISSSQIIKQYGGNAAYFRGEFPAHEVQLDGFWMGVCEVTNAQYLKFKEPHPADGKIVIENGNQLALVDAGEPMSKSRKEFKFSIMKPDLPVTYVGWGDAKSFCEWLTKKTGHPFGLPSEAQWEYACRAGTKTVRYWGDDDGAMGKYANTADATTGKETFFNWKNIKTEDGCAAIAEVGSYEANAFGLHDMLGNIREWCLDSYSPGFYRRSPLQNPLNVVNSNMRVTRGGSWHEGNSYMVRAAQRYPVGGSERKCCIGFRVVCLAPRDL